MTKDTYNDEEMRESEWRKRGARRFDHFVIRASFDICHSCFIGTRL
jgi:hypothetical protein